MGRSQDVKTRRPLRCRAGAPGERVWAATRGGRAKGPWRPHRAAPAEAATWSNSGVKSQGYRPSKCLNKFKLDLPVGAVAVCSTMLTPTWSTYYSVPVEVTEKDLTFFWYFCIPLTLRSFIQLRMVLYILHFKSFTVWCIVRLHIVYSGVVV